MDKENVVSTYNGILLSLEKEGSPAIWDNREEAGGQGLSDINQTQKDKGYMIPCR